MVSEDLRQKFINNGLSYKDIGSKEIVKLKSLIEIELSSFNNDGFLMQLEKTPKKYCKFNGEDGSIKEFYFKVKGNYFRKREAISFNTGGFIGFAGWASSENTKPFLVAFDKWVDYLTV